MKSKYKVHVLLNGILSLILSGVISQVYADCDDPITPGANFSNCDFRQDPFKQDLSNADLTGVNFTNAIFSRNERFNHAILKSANFTGAILPHADFTDAIADGADFELTTAPGSIWDHTSLRYATMTDTDLSPDVEPAATTIDTNLFPSVQPYATYYTIFDNADVHGAIVDPLPDLTGINFVDMDISVAAKFNLANKNMTNAEFISPRTTHQGITGEVVEQDTLKNIDFSNTNLTGAQMEHIDFKGINLNNAILDRASFRWSTFDNYPNMSIDMNDDGNTCKLDQDNSMGVYKLSMLTPQSANNTQYQLSVFYNPCAQNYNLVMLQSVKQSNDWASLPDGSLGTDIGGIMK